MQNKIKATSAGKLIPLDDGDADEMLFFQEVFGFEAKSAGWVREGDRLFYFPDRITEDQAFEKLSEAAPASILEVEAPPLPEGAVSHHLLTMPDGLEVTWIRHPSALPPACRAHWRHHTHMFVLKNESLDFTAYTSIFAYAHLEGADTKFRIFGPGGIRWVDYPSEEAAIIDALDMSLAVAMKIQVVGTPCAGNKVAVYGNYENVGPALRSLFAAYERMGLIITSADLGLSIDLLEQWALPVVPYEGIGAGGVTGVAYSIMTGIFGSAPFTPEEKIEMIRDYICRVMGWSQKYDLPAQVVSDRILFRRALRRRVLQQSQADQIIVKLRRAFAKNDPELEGELVDDLTKRGFFNGVGRFESGGWCFMDTEVG